MTLHRVTKTKQGQRNQYEGAFTRVTRYIEGRVPVVSMYWWVPSLVFNLKSIYFGNVLLVFLRFSQKYWNKTFKATTITTFYIVTKYFSVKNFEELLRIQIFRDVILDRCISESRRFERM